MYLRRTFIILLVRQEMCKCSLTSPELHWLYNSQFLHANFSLFSKNTDNPLNLVILDVYYPFFKSRIAQKYSTSMVTINIFLRIITDINSTGTLGCLISLKI